MSLTKRNVTYKPFTYPEFVELAEISEKMHWVEQEIELTEDIRQWKDGTITPEEKTLVLEIMKTFTQSDAEVATGYIEFFLPYFKNNEVRQMLLSIAAREGIHQRAYALFTDTIGLPEESYSMFLEYEKMADRIEKMTEMDASSQKSMAKSIARTVISEGIALFGAFVMLLNFQRYGKLMGLSKINEWSIKDESLHVEGMILLFRKFLEEHPRIVNDELKRDIYNMFREAVELEDAFIDMAFTGCPNGIKGLTPCEVKQYIRYIADRRLIQLGLKGNFGVKDNPLEWLDSIISSSSMTNFFEQREAEYSAAGLTGDWGWTD
jgi:ribonucleoside-diphosphate reductase beta chain